MLIFIFYANYVMSDFQKSYDAYFQRLLFSIVFTLLYLHACLRAKYKSVSSKKVNHKNYTVLLLY